MLSHLATCRRPVARFARGSRAAVRAPTSLGTTLASVEREFTAPSNGMIVLQPLLAAEQEAA